MMGTYNHFQSSLLIKIDIILQQVINKDISEEEAEDKISALFVDEEVV
jgi:hypothetical protein